MDYYEHYPRIDGYDYCVRFSHLREAFASLIFLLDSQKNRTSYDKNCSQMYRRCNNLMYTNNIQIKNKCITIKKDF